MREPTATDREPEDGLGSHTGVPTPNPIVAGVLVACAYEVVATGINAALDDDTMPLLSNAINAFTWQTFGRRLVPPWALPAGLVSAGFAMSVVLAGRSRTRAS